MKMAARGLGKGLDALIPNTVDKSGTKSKGDNKNNGKDESDKLIKITMIEPNREQPRKNFDEDSLLELAESIKQFGLLQPILVQDKGTYYEIIAGERRWRAAKLAGLKEVPVIIRNLTEQEIVEISLIENIQRENRENIHREREQRENTQREREERGRVKERERIERIYREREREYTHTERERVGGRERERIERIYREREYTHTERERQRERERERENHI